MNKVSIFNWLNNKGHFQGIFWTVCTCFFSVLCDTSIRLVGTSLPAMQITFFRLFLGTLVLLPILLIKGKSFYSMNNKTGHFFRIIIGFGAIACWVYGATQTSLPSITTVSFSCPIFVLPLAYIFLKEKSDWRRISSVAIGFLGVIVIAFFEGKSGTGSSSSLIFHSGVVYLLLGAILFAMSDVINKKMLGTENLFSLLFYFYAGTALISVIPALMVWQPVGYQELFYLTIMAIGGVLVLYCILKATNATEISSIAPYKYVELVFSVILGYAIFREIIQMSTIVGASLIIPGALLIAYYEINKERKMKTVQDDPDIKKAVLEVE